MTHVSLNSVPCLFRLHVKYVSDLFYDKNKTIQEYLIYWIFKLGFFLFLFWLHAWHKSVHNWSWFRTCRYLIGLHPKFWNTDLDYKWCVFQHSTINLLNTWLYKLIYNHLFIYQRSCKKGDIKSTFTWIKNISGYM